MARGAGRHLAVISLDEADEDWDEDDASSDATQLNEEGWAQESSSDDDDEGGEGGEDAEGGAGKAGQLARPQGRRERDGEQVDVA